MLLYSFVKTWVVVGWSALMTICILMAIVHQWASFSHYASVLFIKLGTPALKLKFWILALEHFFFFNFLLSSCFSHVLLLNLHHPLSTISTIPSLHISKPSQPCFHLSLGFSGLWSDYCLEHRSSVFIYP